MKNEQLFNKTVSILVNAYHHGTLVYSSVCACAVGNLIAANCGFKIINVDGKLEWDDANALWGSDINYGEGTVSIQNDYWTPKAMEQIKSTGYNIHEIAKIEQAFFKGQAYGSEDRNFPALMKVIDVLMEIHEANEVQVKEAKQLFIKETV